MSNAPFRLTQLNTTHECGAFDSGLEPLDRYLREQISLGVRRRAAAWMVALADSQRIAGRCA